MRAQIPERTYNERQYGSVPVGQVIMLPKKPHNNYLVHTATQGVVAVLPTKDMPTLSIDDFVVLSEFEWNIRTRRAKFSRMATDDDILAYKRVRQLTRV